ncbi:MAG TPA: FAD-dependent oxidoreductase [Candidatus Sulfopaludibacter sp.]|nr:FAD-dependent oxidoreductase [Candidatus Sulfopaludibacter sp.]
MTAYDFAVVGAGAFGSWTAWHLRRGGASVLLADAWGPAHSRASSGDESRLIRMGYGADEIYTRMAMESLRQWRALFERRGERLFHPTGVLRMARQNDPQSAETRGTLARCGVPVEVLGAADLAARYPQIRLPGPAAFGILETGSGVLLARRAVAAVVEDAVSAGVVYQTRAVARPGDLAAGTVVFACGPWLPKLFPDLLGKRIWPTRQEVFYFAPPAGDRRFASGALPAWVDFTDPRGPYGAPDIENRGIKLGLDRHGPPFDPDTGDRRPSAEGLSEARRFLAERFPALADAPLTESRVCQYENTSSGDFLLDRHPEMDRVWLAGGGSGHGFKHGPAVGEYLAARILKGAPAEPRFAFAAKAETQQRTVY